MSKKISNFGKELSERIHVDRRKFIRNSALTVSLPVFGGLGSAAVQRSKANRIVEENAKPGTPGWQLQYTRFDDPITLASYPLTRELRSSTIEGYASKTSVAPGEDIDIKVSLDPPGAFQIDFYRMGYYGGTGGRHMLNLGPFQGKPQPVPMMTIERLRECKWETATTLTIPKEWPSGVYLGKLTRQERFGNQSYVIFVVREHRPTEILFQVSDLSWQAYNKWPGNDSLYDDGAPSVWYTGPNVRVSFDRPYAKYCQILDAPLSAGSGEFILWEHPLAFWLEKEGYDVTYCSNLDLHLHPEILDEAKVFISVGHDEYWSREMYENAMKARDNGLNLAFFSGNSVYHQVIPYESSITGAPFRAFAREKYFPDEEKLMGSTSYGSGYCDWIVSKPEHWIYEGTGLKKNDSIPGAVGWEFHGPPLLQRDSLEVVAESDTTAEGESHAAVIFRCPKGNWVFNAGTIWWPEGLSQPPGHIPARTPNRGGPLGVNPHIQRMTSNILDRMIRDFPGE